MSTTIRYRQQPPPPPSATAAATTMKLKLQLSPISTPYTKSSIFESDNQKPPLNIDDYFTSFDDYKLQNSASVVKLSQKSLELCTESLGSETGSDHMSADILFSPNSSSKSVATRRRLPIPDTVYKKLSNQSSNQACNQSSKKQRRTGDFPPPLTSTMGGGKVFRVKARREGGRLIVEATETVLGVNGDCGLRAERMHGRLRLTCRCRSTTADCVVMEKFQRVVGRCNENGLIVKEGSCNWVPIS